MDTKAKELEKNEEKRRKTVHDIVVVMQVEMTVVGRHTRVPTVATAVGYRLYCSLCWLQ